MATIEQSVKSQVARVFTVGDWRLFKKFAELNLRDAARLLTRDISIENSLKLLARNSRKRLLIGVGVELLLKAVYLKHGYLINRPPQGSALTFPYKAEDALDTQLVTDKTCMLSQLIENLPEIVSLKSEATTIRGLKIAKVFRNKEGHCVTRAHQFDASNYVDIASSLSTVYRDAFGERLLIKFSVAPREVAKWRVSRLTDA